jgi:plastocyanin
LRRIVISLAAAIAVAATIILPAQAKFTGLKGEVNGNFQIKVTKNGVRVKTIKAGTYRMKIEDKSSAHNFRLKGPGFNRATSVSFVGERMWTVKLKPGRYTFQCDPHASSGMKGTFRVTA